VAECEALWWAARGSCKAAKKVCLQLTPENVETQCWIVKIVWQQIQDPRARNSKNNDDQSYSDDSAEQSTSADWQTADVDDQQRQPLVCRYSSGTVEPWVLRWRKVCREEPQMQEGRVPDCAGCNAKTMRGKSCADTRDWQQIGVGRT